MKTLGRSIVVSALIASVSACVGSSVQLGNTVTGPAPSGPAREITSSACGFQLLLLIPININDRMQRAYVGLQAQAAGDYITDVEIQETWGYRFIGTSYCTNMRAKAISTKAS